MITESKSFILTTNCGDFIFFFFWLLSYPSHDECVAWYRFNLMFVWSIHLHYFAILSLYILHSSRRYFVLPLFVFIMILNQNLSDSSQFFLYASFCFELTCYFCFVLSCFALFRLFIFSCFFFYRCLFFVCVIVKFYASVTIFVSDHLRPLWFKENIPNPLSLLDSIWFYSSKLLFRYETFQICCHLCFVSAFFFLSGCCHNVSAQHKSTSKWVMDIVEHYNIPMNTQVKWIVQKNFAISNIADSKHFQHCKFWFC